MPPKKNTTKPKGKGKVAKTKKNTTPAAKPTARSKIKDKNVQAEEIHDSLAKIFQDAQLSMAGHKKQIVLLKNLLQTAHKLDLDDEFNLSFCKMINKILPIKRTEVVGDRIVKLIAGFVNSLSTESDESENQADQIEDDSEIETVFSKFIYTVVRHLSRGLDAKDKNVRYRVCHLLSHLMHNMTSIDDDLYKFLFSNLLTRVYDKEPPVRLKAVTCIASFQNDDGAEEISEAAQKLLVIVQNDPSPEVRRAAVLQLENNKLTRPYILERARDVNSTNRRIIYSKVLKTFKDFRTIPSNERIKLLTWGLRDREESVQKATTKLLCETWLQNVDNDVMELLERLKVMESDISETAVKVFLENRKDITAKISFNDDAWNNLTPEAAFLLRLYYEHCNRNNLMEELEKSFPEAAPLAEILQRYFELRKTNMKNIEEHMKRLEEDANAVPLIDLTDPKELDFVLEQLLKISVDYDFSDDFGRRNILNVLRTALSNDKLSDTLIEVLLQVIRKISINENDFSQMIVEIITDLKDNGLENQFKPKKKRDGKKSNSEGKTGSEFEEDADEEEDEEFDDTFVSAVSEVDNSGDLSAADRANKSLQKESEQLQQLSPDVMIECLTIARRMLQLLNEPIKENISVNSLIPTLIHPAVRRTETEIRELSLICLGLCCILDKELAINSMFLYGVCVSKGEDSLKITALQVICDLLSIHGTSILESDTPNSVDSLAIAKLYYRTLRDDSKKDVQAASGESLYKLFLSDILSEDELFESTLLAYFNPSINNNEKLKQCLSFCIPVYSFSHVSHQDRVSRVVCDTLVRLFQSWNDMQESLENNNNNINTLSNSITTPSNIIQQLIYWTDPYRVVRRSEEDAMRSSIQIEVGIHLLRVLEHFEYLPANKQFVKAILISLPKLTFTKHGDLEKLKQLYFLLSGEKLLGGEFDKALKDAPSRNAYTRFKEYVEECLAGAAELVKLDENENENENETKEDDVKDEIADASTQPNVKQEKEGEDVNVELDLDENDQDISNNGVVEIKDENDSEINISDISTSSKTSLKRKRRGSKSATAKIRKVTPDTEELKHLRNNIQKEGSLIGGSDRSGQGISYIQESNEFNIPNLAHVDTDILQSSPEKNMSEFSEFGSTNTSYHQQQQQAQANDYYEASSEAPSDFNELSSPVKPGNVIPYNNAPNYTRRRNINHDDSLNSDDF
ncbi:hypothetical protein B5S32_g4 [[Candida] boidinii]|nr:hypothetical protein B5S32_g4 [[Candida] boidinii]